MDLLSAVSVQTKTTEDTKTRTQRKQRAYVDRLHARGAGSRLGDRRRHKGTRAKRIAVFARFIVCMYARSESPYMLLI